MNMLEGILSFNLTALGVSTCSGCVNLPWVLGRSSGVMLISKLLYIACHGQLSRDSKSTTALSQLSQELPEKDRKDFKLRNPQFYLNKISD